MTSQFVKMTSSLTFFDILEIQKLEIPPSGGWGNLRMPNSAPMPQMKRC